jgi:hypothetical protein
MPEADDSAGGLPKLKPLHWDKVRATSDRAMVWDQLKSSSFQLRTGAQLLRDPYFSLPTMHHVSAVSFRLDEDMIEALFMNNSMPAAPARDAGRKPGMPPFRQEERVLDPKKAQNIAILLRALNVTREEVSDALLDGERSYNTDCSTAVTNLLPLTKLSARFSC